MQLQSRPPGPGLGITWPEAPGAGLTTFQLWSHPRSKPASQRWRGTGTRLLSKAPVYKCGQSEIRPGLRCHICILLVVMLMPGSWGHREGWRSSGALVHPDQE